MAGGELQLLAPSTSVEGQQMSYLVGVPQISYFKSVYRRHTNFALESITESFVTAPTLNQASSISVSCVLRGRRADLLKEVYLAFSLPPIYSDDAMRFRWVDNLAHYAILSASVSLDSGRNIDQLYGEWMDVWSELTASESRKGLLARMTGNTPDWTSPVAKVPRATLANNLLSYSFYPVGAKPAAGSVSLGTPSVQGRTFYVPLRFWFTRPGMSLPLCALRFQTISITLQMRPLDELYQVFDPGYATGSARYVSPSTYRTLAAANALYAGDPNISAFLAPDLAARGNLLDLNASLECNYVFLDTAEKLTMTSAHHQILCEQVFRFEQVGASGANNVVNMPLNNPIKEYVWFLRRTDAKDTNAWSTFTDQAQAIMASARLVWNKTYDRIQTKDAGYFQYIQPHQHHSGNPRDGIYAYSFALYPEKTQPSGAYNTAIITGNQLFLSLKPPPAGDGATYDCVVYALGYNVFEALGGVGALKFTT